MIVNKVGIVGAGIAGMTAGILLAEAGIDVEILEGAENPSLSGSGITLQGNALRILQQIGAWDRIKELGYAFDSIGIRAPDPDATVLAIIDDVRTGGPELPATLGMRRPELAEILRKLVHESGGRIRYGCTLTATESDNDTATAILATGERLSYDLLIGADGINSTTRKLLGIDIEPRSTGAGAWRVVVPRPTEIVRTDLIYGGPNYIAGYCPTSDDSIYAYIIEDARMRDLKDGPAVFKELAGHYGGPWKEIAASVDDDTPINYTWFTTHLVEGPWHRGRIMLIGDAVHNCPPTIAQGAAMALEDASVLVEELLGADGSMDQVLLRVQGRRFGRAKVVVESSTQLVEWMVEGRTDGDVPGLIHKVALMLEVPA
ncbi:FAD-dependent monooxygenase [Williamsia sp.]|uniref:FAD-dependent monooxygenase n=1 Tax=Williamsia sp. TaxID=1872085 RepID=UPI002F92295E